MITIYLSGLVISLLLSYAVIFFSLRLKLISVQDAWSATGLYFVACLVWPVTTVLILAVAFGLFMDRAISVWLGLGSFQK